MFVLCKKKKCVRISFQTRELKEKTIQLLCMLGEDGTIPNSCLEREISIQQEMKPSFYIPENDCKLLLYGEAEKKQSNVNLPSSIIQ